MFISHFTLQPEYEIWDEHGKFHQLVFVEVGEIWNKCEIAYVVNLLGLQVDTALSRPSVVLLYSFSEFTSSYGPTELPSAENINLLLHRPCEDSGRGGGIYSRDLLAD